ncbi:MAG: polysaccharide biosynthesis/export family protein [Verrucomicrobiota bacterium]
MKTASLILLSLCFGVLVASSAEPAQTNAPTRLAGATSMATLDDRQKLGPGDRITYHVIEDKDEPRTLTVKDTGELDVPYYGLVEAAGKTSRQLAQEIKKLLERDLYYRATVMISVEVVNKARVTGRVYVTGQVRTPGGFEIPADEHMTVSKAVLRAGGFSDFSDKRNVHLVRKTATGAETFKVNVLDVWQKGALEKDLVVQPGDMIVVPARLVNF